MRGPLPLSDSDFAAVRAKVLSEIERPRRSYGWVLALAASVVVAVMTGVMARRPVERPPLTRRSAPPSPRFAGRGPSQPAPLLPARGEKGAGGRMRGRHRKPQPLQLARIELHTADPDIRIIWITHQEAP